MDFEHTTFATVLMLLLAGLIGFDLLRGRVPWAINGLLAAAGLVQQLWDGGLARGAFGCCSAGVTLALLMLTAAVARRIDARATIGTGDILFLVSASLWVGVSGSIAILWLACLLVVAVAGFRRVVGSVRHGQSVAVMPALALAMLTVTLSQWTQ